MSDDMTETDRLRLAVAAKAKRLELQSKKAAYTAADVNAATWDKLEKGEYVRPHTLTKLVARLWPDTGGDWSRVPGVPDDAVMLGDSPVARRQVKAGGLDGLLRSILARVDAVEARLVVLESGGMVDLPVDELASRRQEVSDADDTLAPAALDAEEGVDEEPGGSDHDES